MMLDKTYTLQDLIDFDIIQIGDGYRATNSELSSEGYPFARAGNLNNGFNFREADKFPIKNIDKVGYKISQPWDCVFTSKGTVGRIALVKEDTEQFIYSPQLCYWRSNKHDVIDPVFLYYWMHGDEFINQIDYLKGQTDMADYVSLRDQKKMKITIPSWDRQQKIRKHIFSIDNKIELNRQTNQTLEQIAQAIFKSWFVDFEPVKAKIAAKQAGANSEQIEQAAICAISGKTLEQLAQLDPQILQQLKATAALFPDALVDSELGEIPEGWEIKTIDDVVKRLTAKKRYTKYQVKSFGEVPVYEQGADILLGYHNEEAGFVATSYAPIIIFGDHTCVTHLSCESFDISQNVIALTGKGYPTMWVYYAIQGKQEFQEYRRHWSELIIKEIITPQPEIAVEYAKLISALYKQKEQFVKESKCLEQLRDSLLPKLLSGEISLSTL